MLPRCSSLPGSPSGQQPDVQGRDCHVDTESQLRWNDAKQAARQRVDMLCAAGVPGAPAEERFDRLTRLVQRLLRAPVALITLLDMERQFFLSAQGLAEPWAS